MGKTVELEITGVAEVKARLGLLKESIEPAVITGVNRGLMLIERRAKHRCPVDTGGLRDSIATKPATPQKGGSVKGLVFTPKEYAIYVECGTGVRGRASFSYTLDDFTPKYKPGWPGQIAQSYLIPSMLESKTDAIKMVAEAIKESIKKGKS